jgi:hypothetical protein
MNKVSTIAQFIPIVLIFILISFSKSAVKFSNTILGKIIAVCIIIFYVMIDKLLGTAVCLFIIFYYQTDIYENMLNMDLDESDNIATVEVEIKDQPGDHEIDDYVFLEPDSKKKKEGMMNYIELYDDNSDNILFKNDELQKEFRKENCVKGELMNKDMKVKYELTEHVFPEVRFRRGFCNPCQPDCEYSIIEQKLDTEGTLRVNQGSL